MPMMRDLALFFRFYRRWWNNQSKGRDELSTESIMLQLLMLMHRTLFFIRNRCYPACPNFCCICCSKIFTLFNYEVFGQVSEKVVCAIVFLEYAGTAPI